MCRFPLLLHYLEQQENVEIPQWHNWLLDLLTGAYQGCRSTSLQCGSGFTLMQIRILIKVMRICDHWYYPDPPGSILSLHASIVSLPSIILSF
jgi:hypothetical protein